MRCIRCGEEFEHPGTNVCGNCADDLRQEEEAKMAYALNRDACEEEKLMGWAEKCDEDIRFWP